MKSAIKEMVNQIVNSGGLDIDPDGMVEHASEGIAHVRERDQMLGVAVSVSADELEIFRANLGKQFGDTDSLNAEILRARNVLEREKISPVMVALLLGVESHLSHSHGPIVSVTHLVACAARFVSIYRKPNS